MLVIDPDSCIDCGACEPECPVGAIYPENDVPAQARAFTSINAAVRRGTDAVDEALAEHLARACSHDAGRDPS